MSQELPPQVDKKSLQETEKVRRIVSAISGLFDDLAFDELKMTTMGLPDKVKNRINSLLHEYGFADLGEVAGPSQQSMQTLSLDEINKAITKELYKRRRETRISASRRKRMDQVFDVRSGVIPQDAGNNNTEAPQTEHERLKEFARYLNSIGYNPNKYVDTDNND